MRMSTHTSLIRTFLLVAEADTVANTVKSPLSSLLSDCGVSSVIDSGLVHGPAHLGEMAIPATYATLSTHRRTGSC